MGCFALKADQQGLEFVNPCERSFTDEAALVHSRVEISFPSTLDRFSVAFIFRNVGLDPPIPQQFPRCARIEAAIHVKDRTVVVQPTALHVSEEVLELLLKRITVMMIASHNPCRGDNVAMRIRYWQDVAGLRFLPSLIGDRFAPFFAALWLPSRLSSDKFNSPWMVMILASKSRCKLPSRLHLRK